MKAGAVGWVALLCLGACGRFAFDPLTGGPNSDAGDGDGNGSGNGDANGDAPSSGCGVGCEMFTGDGTWVL